MTNAKDIFAGDECELAPVDAGRQRVIEAVEQMRVNLAVSFAWQAMTALKAKRMTEWQRALDSVNSLYPVQWPQRVKDVLTFTPMAGGGEKTAAKRGHLTVVMGGAR